MRTAVITGGGGGLGRALAQGLQARGWFTALLDLPGGFDGLQDGPHCSLHPCDITDPAQVRACVADLRAARATIDLAVYNAGVTLIAPFAGMDPAAHRRAFEVNYWGAVTLASELLPDLRRARGTHLAITSVAGFAPLKHRTAYAASKHAMTGFFTSLRAEEAPHGVRVTLAAPSFVATNPGARYGADGIGRPGAARDGIDAMSPDQAAQAILKGVDRGRDFIPVGRVAALSWWLNRLAPGLYARMMVRSVARETP
ncbi:MAG: SDR family NAD(P)-dependent oxidoreductase [Rhodobacter sp.]|nr:SDR family NAD(P)-dependent oxidoreductase [Paracoccaceae bacterium]MCC0079021.1 SDR family NAD(P)-dependent oxidoreductase [Rhodobacter sp.]